MIVSPMKHLRSLQFQTADDAPSIARSRDDLVRDVSVENIFLLISVIEARLLTTLVSRSRFT